jgi:8-hydroxy-5-deazaflavin:NADPH oxidoreductase
MQLHMRIRIFGCGPLAAALTGLAERAGHTVWRSGPTPLPPYADELLDLVILAGDRRTVDAELANVSAESLRDLIVVDALTPVREDPAGSSSESAAASISATTLWIGTMLPEARIVHAFASVPAHAFMELLSRGAFEDTSMLAVPIAGDDADAKAAVEMFIRDIGSEPFDLGPSSVAEVLAPGGPLWGKALSQLEMFEAVGWLSGDG